jgi:hypothetical protein
MRRPATPRLVTLACVLAALLGAPLPSRAQVAAPVPQVTITGFLDTITAWSKNLQDTLLTRSGDREWYVRNRGRLDVIGQIGLARFVMGLEIDSVWGQVSGADNNLASGGVNAQRFGATSAFDLNTDTQGSIEMRHLYTEFPVPGMPFATTLRLGAQPFAVNYKLAAIATGDFAGADLQVNLSRSVKWHLTYAALEENLTGGRRTLGFGRGDDWALVTSVEFVPIRGLDVRPIYALLQGYGALPLNARQTVGGPTGTPTFARASPGGAPGAGQVEDRHTIGVDARWRSGPFSLDPTFLYQFGSRDTDNPFVAAGSSARNRVTRAAISAFFFDVIGGWWLGPVVVEGRYVYTSGNRPRDQLHRTVNYYQPIDTDTTFWGAGWGEIYSLGVDYFNGALRGMGLGIGMDRYGRQQLAARATYLATHDLDLRAVVTSGWTARSVDTDGTTAFAGGGSSAGPITCNTATTGPGAGCRGDASYMGTEIDLGLTWRFAPGLSFDLVGAVLFTGGAFDTSEVVNGELTKRSARNVYTVVSRVRFAF